MATMKTVYLTLLTEELEKNGYKAEFHNDEILTETDHVITKANSGDTRYLIINHQTGEERTYLTQDGVIAFFKEFYPLKPQPVIKFLFNGMKVDGELFKGSYTKARNDEAITLYASNYARFPHIEGAEHINDTDVYTDYFDNDRLIFKEDHPLYPQVLAAYNKLQERYKKLNEKREAKWAAKRAAKQEALKDHINSLN